VLEIGTEAAQHVAAAIEDTYRVLKWGECDCTAVKR